MTEHEFNIKTAEMCGYNIDECEIGDGYFEVPIDELVYIDWRPKNNIEQAMEALKALRERGCDIAIYLGYHNKYNTVIIHPPREGVNPYQKSGDILTETIYQAVKKYLESEV